MDSCRSLSNLLLLSFCLLCHTEEPAISRARDRPAGTRETLWNGETRESLDLLKTSHADSSKPMHWMVSTTAENLLCDANHKIISRAISNCIKGHRKCRRAVPTLPTRVLEVLPATNGLSVRLYEPTPGETGTYAALSYCWGGPQPFQTTVDKLEGYKTSIDPARLPRTVMDAAIVTGVLGLRFLWVDSFCIIQDSDDDMSRELSEMHLIYQRAFVTIAAADARTAMAGFLDTVGKPRPPTFKLPCFDRSGKRGSMYLTPCTPIEKQPINQRAWCMVENLLSTRYLVFDAAQRTIELHCREGVFGNGGGQDLMVFKDAQTFLQSTLLPKTRHREMPGGKKPRARKKKREDDSDETSSSSDSSAASSVDQARLDDFWYSLVYSYAGRSLTDPADKLPAFSAVAQSFSQLWGGRYMAGLWERHFPTCLLWRMASNTAESYFDIYNRTRQGKDEFYDRGRKSSIGRRPRNADGQVFARAPSWSWASVDGSIEYGGRR
ncbi:heterokaryon incompatibility protein-domain-containing protein [Xylariaceae sp. FL0804]|nr:heterokaryon incompatibility protein-domain-containing protein [Xylariaceae sp. FL0804]